MKKNWMVKICPKQPGSFTWRYYAADKVFGISTRESATRFTRKEANLIQGKMESLGFSVMIEEA
jgi:hypothetical protein